MRSLFHRKIQLIYQLKLMKSLNLKESIYILQNTMLKDKLLLIDRNLLKFLKVNINYFLTSNKNIPCVSLNVLKKNFDDL